MKIKIGSLCLRTAPFSPTSMQKRKVIIKTDSVSWVQYRINQASQWSQLCSPIIFIDSCWVNEKLNITKKQIATSFLEHLSDKFIVYLKVKFRILFCFLWSKRLSAVFFFFSFLLNSVFHLPLFYHGHETKQCQETFYLNYYLWSLSWHF